MSRITVVALLATLLAGCAAAPPPPPPPETVAKPPADLLRLAQMSLDRGSYEDARGRFTRYLAADPNEKAAQLGLAEALLGLRDAATARTVFENLMDDPDYRARALQGSGLCAAVRGDAAEGEPLLRQAVEADAGLWRAWNGLGRLYDAQSRWSEAGAAYGKALEAAPQSPVVANNLGYSLLLQGRHDQAIGHFVAALERDPRLEPAYANLRLGLAAAGRYDDAVANVPRERLAVVLNNVGYMAMRRLDYGRAEGLLTQAIEKSAAYYGIAWSNLDRLKAIRAERRGR